MKTINTLQKLIVISLIFLAAQAIAGDAIDAEQYNVKINGIPMSKESAEILLGHIGKGYQVIDAYDNINKEPFFLSSTEKNMDVTIKNDFLDTVSGLYKNALKQNKKATASADKNCASTAVNNSEINLCIDKKSKAVIEIEIKN